MSQLSGLSPWSARITSLSMPSAKWVWWKKDGLVIHTMTQEVSALSKQRSLKLTVTVSVRGSAFPQPTNPSFCTQLGPGTQHSSVSFMHKLCKDFGITAPGKRDCRIRNIPGALRQQKSQKQTGNTTSFWKSKTAHSSSRFIISCNVHNGTNIPL